MAWRKRKGLSPPGGRSRPCLALHLSRTLSAQGVTNEPPSSAPPSLCRGRSPCLQYPFRLSRLPPTPEDPFLLRGPSPGPDRLAAPPTSPLCCCGLQPWPVPCVWHWPGCLSSHPATSSPDVSPRAGLPQHLRLHGWEPGSPGSPPAAATGHGSPSGESTFIVRAYRLPARL